MIIIKKIPRTNTIYKHWPLKNAGADNQMILQFDRDKLTRLLIGAPSDNWVVNNFVDIYDNVRMDMQIYVSMTDIYKDNINFNLHHISGDWQTGVYRDNSRTLAHLKGSSWKRRNQENWTIYGGDTSSTTPMNVNIIDYKKLIVEDIQHNENFQNGYLMKLNNQDDESNKYGKIMMYAANTKSPYYPRYIYYINDYVYDNTDMQVTTQIDKNYFSLMNLKQYYNNEQVVEFKLKITQKQYARDWETSYWTNEQIQITYPQTYVMTYAVYDVTQFERIEVMGHSEYTRISVGGGFNYFTLDMNSLMKNRKYQVQLKVNNRIIRLRESFKVV